MKIKILYLSIILLNFISLNILADHIIVSGEASGEWNADTVLVTGDILIPDGESLFISPGTRVEFQGSYALLVEGSLIAAGQQNDSIYLYAADTAGFAIDTIPDGGWRGIRFDHNRNSNDTSVFSHCHFSFGKIASDDPLTGNGGAINVKAYNKVSISHCLFQDNFASYNGGAISLDSADVIINNSFFTRNRCGLAVAPWGYGGAICSDNSNPEIRWNVFDDNSSTGVGGGLAVRFKDCNLYNNIFTGNVSGLGGGFGFLHIPEIYYRINNNLVAGNYAVFFGGGVANINASPIYINNTIVYNQAMYGGGFYCKDSISPDFYNTIIWGNSAAVGAQGYLFEVYSQADFFNCDVQGGPDLFGGSGGGEAFFGTFEQCLDTIPRFAGAGDYPYSLVYGSPCIDMGSSDTSGFMLPAIDLAGFPRISGDIIDMGAYELLPTGVGEETEAKKDEPVKVWPNPFVDHVIAGVTLKEEKQVLIEIYDMTGKKVSDAFIANLFKGEQQFLLNINDSETPGGVYLMKILLGNEVFYKKLIKSFSQRGTK